MAAPLTCAVGVATYQRPDVLLDCLRHLLRSTRVPDEIVVADASPTAAEVRARVERELPELGRATRFAYLATPRGITVQRNWILDNINSDVILFLDDDALAAPEYVARVTEVFEADTAGRVGGIEGVALEGPDAAPPSGPAHAEPTGRRFPRLSRTALRSVLDALRLRYLGPHFPEAVLAPVHAIPEAVRHLPVTAVRTLYGCVMSYRTALARQYRFNERLRRYAFLEDFEMSYRLGKHYVLLRRLDAFARHLRFSGGRLDPSLVHYSYLINLAYIARSAMDWTPTLRRHLDRHARRFVLCELSLGWLRKTGFSQYRGARSGLEQSQAIFDAADDQVAPVYERAAEMGFERGTF